MANTQQQYNPREWLKRLASHLLRRRLITQKDLDEVLQFQVQIDRRIGQLAALKGYLTPRDVIFIIASQAELDMRFGDIAMKHGLMDRDQIAHILELQNNPFKLFVECLMFTRLVPVDELRGIMADFLHETRVPLLEEDRSASEAQPVPPPMPEQRPYRFTRDEVQVVLGRIRDFATLPAVVNRIMIMLADPDAKIEDLAKVIESDPALATRVLRMVNSSFFPKRQKINTVSKGIITLGLRGIKQLVLTASVMDKLNKAEQDKAREIWRHSLLTAQWTRALAQRRGIRGDELDNVALAGLLHDIGKLVILQQFPDAIDPIEKAVQDGSSRMDAEENLLTMRHTDIGGLLCHFWNFPPSMTQAILYHHASPMILKTLRRKLAATDCVNAACRLAHVAILEGVEDAMDTEDMMKIEKEFFDYYGMPPDDVHALSRGVLKASRETMCQLFR